MLEDILGWGVMAFSVLGWVMYIRENQRYRDAVTDLIGVMHRHEISSDELRRTEDHKKTKRFRERE